jgi:hypothetical protein
VDGVLYVVRLGSTDLTRAKRGLEKLAQAGARVVGGVYVSKGYFDLLSSVPVPGRVAGVEKIVRNTETRAERESAAPASPEADEPTTLQTAETDEEPMSNATETAEKPAVESGENGMDDLESVLQGWRRRDHAEPAPATTFETRPNLPEARTAKDDIREALLSAPTAPEAESAPEADAEEAVAAAPIFLTEPIIVAPEAPAAVEADKEPKEEKEEKEEKVEAASKKKAEKEEKEEKAPEPAVEEKAVVEAEAKAEEPAPAPVAEPKAQQEEKAPEPAPAPAPEARSESAPVIPVAPPAPIAVAPPAPAPVASAPAAPVAAPVAAHTRDSFQELDVQIDMFPTAPGEMTMRAVTSNAAAVGIPNVVLEMTTQMHAMRGMRAITPSQGDPDAPRIALETSTTDTPDAARMRILVGEGADAAFEAVLKTGEAISVRTGGGANQPSVRLEMNNDKNGGTVVRATVEGGKDRQEVVLEMKREALTDSFSDAKWKNRVSIFGGK